MRYPLTLSLSFFLVACGLANAQSTTYSFNNLQYNGPALAINDRGQVLLGNSQIYSQESGNYQPVSLGNNANVSAFNSLDQLVGYDLNGASNGNVAASYQNGLSGTPSQFYFEPNTFSRPSGINDAGTIVGSITVGGTVEGVLYQNGKSTPIMVPGSTSTYITGINDSGIVVGYYLGPYYDGPVGFYYNQYGNGDYYGMRVPETALTVVTGINNLGQVVGYYVGAKGVQRGFIYYSSTNISSTIVSPGTFKTINYPNANSKGSGIQLTGINDEGQVVGNITSVTGQVQPFIATPSTFTGF